MIAFNAAYACVLSGWPLTLYAQHGLPWFALLFAGALWQFGVVDRAGSARRAGQIAVVLAMVAISVPGLRDAVRYASAAPFHYRDAPVVQNAADLDRWLADQGHAGAEVITICPKPVAFGQTHYRLVYRLALTSEEDQWNAPDKLLPQVRARGDVFMTCDAPVYWSDWKRALADLSSHSERLEEIGRVGEYVFYRVIHAE